MSNRKLATHFMFGDRGIRKIAHNRTQTKSNKDTSIENDLIPNLSFCVWRIFYPWFLISAPKC
jgi:hypothetical protein